MEAVRVRRSMVSRAVVMVFFIKIPLPAAAGIFFLENFSVDYYFLILYMRDIIFI